MKIWEAQFLNIYSFIIDYFDFNLVPLLLSFHSVWRTKEAVKVTRPNTKNDLFPQNVNNNIDSGPAFLATLTICLHIPYSYN